MASAEVPPYPDASQEHHLSSVSAMYNRMPYCIIGRISFDFRVDEDDGNEDEAPGDNQNKTPVLSKVMLSPLVNPQSQAQPSAIEVFFHGRWRKACSFLKKRDVICVSNARVEQAEDVDVHEWQLAFYDEQEVRSSARLRKRYRKSQSKNDRGPAIFVMAGHNSSTRYPSHVVCLNRLDDGRLPLNHKSNGRGTDRPDSACAAELAAAVHTNKRAKPQLANDRSYIYATIATLHEKADNMSSTNRAKGEMFHVYGVIIDSRSPSICTGPDLRSYITIIDESSVGGTSAIAGLRTLEVYRFDVDPRNGTPFCVRGDIVRCHRLQLSRFDDKKGVRHVQGHAQCHSTFLLWAADSDDGEPIIRMCPTRGPGKKPDAQHTLTENDRVRVNALREFSRRYLSEEPVKIDAPWLKTVDDVVNAPFGAPFLASPFNIIGKYVEGPNNSMAGLGQIRFAMKDGREGMDNVIINIESVMTHEHRLKCGQFTFESFVRSIRTHREAKREAEWVLIHDVELLTREGRNVCGKLTVGRHTSTIQWLPEYASEVRSLLSRSNSHTSNVNTNGATNGYGLENNAIQNGAVAMEAQQQQPQQNGSERRVNGMVVGQNSSEALREAAEAVEAEKHAEQQAVENAMATRWNTVGKHNGMHLPISSILQVVHAALRDDRTPKRIQARVCSWQEPEDLRATTRRYCSACEEYVIGDSTACAVCGLSTTWAWRVRWRVAADDGCNIDAWVVGRHSEMFFGRPPKQMGVDSCKWVRQFALNIIKNDVRLDCLVLPYSVLWHGVKQPVCMIVETKIEFEEEKQGSNSDANMVH